MWITVYVVCLSVIVSCIAQVTKNEANSVTETVQTNQEVEWDTTGPSVTVSIKDGRSGAENGPRSEVPSHPLFYSNQWHPFLLSIGENGDRYLNTRHHYADDDRSKYHLMPTFLRRPDSDLNRTSSNPFMQLHNSFRYPYGPLPMPITPFNPMLFYPHNRNLSPSENYPESNSSIMLQNSSDSISQPVMSNAEPTYLKDTQESIGASSPFVPDVLERFHPINFYRNADGFLPPPHPPFLPYPVTPNANDKLLNPGIYPFVNNPIYDSERIADVIENIPTRQDVTERDVNKQKASTVSKAPSDSSSSFVPLEPLPLPFASFPFGALPPPIFPPIIPEDETPVNPVTNPVSLPKESAVTDIFLPYPSVPPTNPSLESSPGYLIPANAIKSEGEIPAIIDTDVERTATENKSSEEKIPYEFGYDMNDGQGTDQHRKEVSDVSGTVRGSYGYRDMFGVYRFVNYIADKNGFRAFIKSNEPGVATSGSANVVVLAERPPVQTTAEGEKVTNSEPLTIPDTSTDLIAEGSDTKVV